MSEKMKNLGVRTLSGAVLAVVVLGAILWSQWSFGLLLAVLLVGGMTEFYALAGKRGGRPQRFVGLVAGLVLFALNFAFVSDDIQILGSANRAFGCGMAFLLLLLPVMFICELYRRSQNPMWNIGSTLLAVINVAIPVSLLAMLPVVGSHDGTWNSKIVVAYFCIIWANDIFAFLIGITLGRHRLFERISPKKSWEGFAAGIVAATAAAALIGHYAFHMNVWVWAGLGLVTALSGVAGDLVESMFKRAAGVKDSGSIMPGHGGWLDRFDATIMSSPFVFVYLLIFGNLL